MRKSYIEDALDAQANACQAEGAFGKIRNFEYFESLDMVKHHDIIMTLMVTTDFGKISCLLDNVLLFLFEYNVRLKELVEKEYYDTRATSFLGECTKLAQSMRNRAMEMYNACSVEEIEGLIPEVKNFKNIEKVLALLRMVYQVEARYKKGGKLEKNYASEVFEFHYR